MASIRSVLFTVCCIFGIASVHGGFDFTCLVTNCASDWARCGIDKNCVTGFMCIASCAWDKQCILECHDKYYSEALISLLDCVLNENKCVQAPEERLQAEICRNRPESKSLPDDFTLSTMTGLYYNVYGMNPLYDCKDFSQKNFTMTSNGKLWLAESYTVQINGVSREINGEREFEPKSSSKPAIMRAKSLLKGLNGDDEYRVLSFNKNYVFVYYCGSLSGMGYEGASVYSRTPKLSAEDTRAVEKEALTRGLKWSTFCACKQKDGE